jgi:putative transposase
MDVSQARKLKVLEEENGRLKRLLADAMLDNAVLTEVAATGGGDRGRSPWARRFAVPHKRRLAVRA